MAAISVATAWEDRGSDGPAVQSNQNAVVRFYRPELDALRFFAFLAVFACHGLPFPGGQHPHILEATAWRILQLVREAGSFGVCLFFVLSSYLITELLRREAGQTGEINLRAFYLRRILRIWPLYFTVLCLSGAVGSIAPAIHMRPGQLLANLLFVGNWFIVANPTATIPLAWLWSISVEEQFYIVWPAITRLGGLRCVGICSLLCVPLSAVSIAFAALHWQHLDVTVWLNSAVQFQFFALGALIALFLSGKSPRISRWWRVAMFAAASACWIAASGACLIKDPLTTPSIGQLYIGYELVALGCLLFFFSALGADVRRVSKRIIYLGKISYGLYVFHGIALLLTTTVRQTLEALGGPQHGVAFFSAYLADRIVGLILTIALSSLSYKYLETPFLKLKSRFTSVQSRAV